MAGATPSDPEESEQQSDRFHSKAPSPTHSAAATAAISAASVTALSRASINFDIQPVVLVSRLTSDDLDRFLKNVGHRRSEDRRRRDRERHGEGHRSRSSRRRSKNRRTRTSAAKNKRSPSEKRRPLPSARRERRRNAALQGGVDPVVIKFIKENSNSSDGFSEWSVRDDTVSSTSSNSTQSRYSLNHTSLPVNGIRISPTSVSGQSSDSRHTSLETDTEPYVSDDEAHDGRDHLQLPDKKVSAEQHDHVDPLEAHDLASTANTAATHSREEQEAKTAGNDIPIQKTSNGPFKDRVPEVNIAPVDDNLIGKLGREGKNEAADDPSLKAIKDSVEVVSDNIGKLNTSSLGSSSGRNCRDAKRLKLSEEKTSRLSKEKWPLAQGRIDKKEKLRIKDERTGIQLKKGDGMAVETRDEQVSLIEDELNDSAAQTVDQDDLDQIVLDNEGALVVDESEAVAPSVNADPVVHCGKRAELELDLYASLATMELMSSSHEDEEELVKEYTEERRIERLTKMLANEVSEEAKRLTATCLADKSDIVARLFRLLREVSHSMQPSNSEVLHKIIKLENVLRELVANYQIEQESIDVSNMESLTGQRKTTDDLVKLEHTPTLQEYLGLRVEPPVQPGCGLAPLPSPAPFKDLQNMVQHSGGQQVANIQLASQSSANTGSLLSGGNHQLIVAGANTGVVVPSVDHELLRKSLAQTLGAQLSQRPAFRVPPPTEQQLLQAAQMRNFVPRPRPINSTKYQPYPSVNPQQIARMGAHHPSSQQQLQQVAQQHHQLQVQQQRIALQQQQQQFHAQQLARQNQLRLQQQQQQQQHLQQQHLQQQQQRLAQLQAQQQQAQQRQFALAQQQQQQLQQQQQQQRITAVSSPVSSKAPPASSPKPAATAISLPAGLSITPLAPPKKSEIQLPKDIEMIPIQQKEPPSLPKLPPGITLTSVPGSQTSSSASASTQQQSQQQQQQLKAGILPPASVSQQQQLHIRQQHQSVAVQQVAVQHQQQRQQQQQISNGGAAVIHKMMMQQVPTGRGVGGTQQAVDQRQLALQQQQQQQLLRHQQLQQQQQQLQQQQQRQQLALQQQQQAQQQQWRLQQQAQQQRLQQIMQRQQQQLQSTNSQQQQQQQQQHFYRISNAQQQQQQQQQATATVQQRWQQAQQAQQQRQFFQ